MDGRVNLAQRDHGRRRTSPWPRVGAIPRCELREAGIADVGQVERAVLESSGELGIIRSDEKPTRTTKKNPVAKR